jgi:hypothetical protein
MSWIRNTECNRQVFKYSEKFNHFAKRRMEVVSCGRSFEDGGVAALPQLFQLHVRLQLTERRIAAEGRVSLRLPPTEPEMNNHPPTSFFFFSLNILPELSIPAFSVSTQDGTT